MVPERFSWHLETEKYNIGTLKNANDHIREIIAVPNVDVYIIHLGLNDLRNETPRKVIDRLYELIDSLLARTGVAKIMVSTLIPCLSDRDHTLADRVPELNEMIVALTSDMRKKLDLHNKLYTIFQNNFLKVPKFELCPLYKPDGIHLKEGGTRRLFGNIKACVLRAFGIPLPKKRFNNV